MSEYAETRDVKMLIMHPDNGARRSRGLLSRLAATFNKFRLREFDGVLLIDLSRT